jgi:predicted nucleic acid-binding protein
MKIYFDVSCLNRPFDDQIQPRIRIESEAILLILERFDAGDWQHIASDMTVLEIEAIQDSQRRERVAALLPLDDNILELEDRTLDRAEELQRRGFTAADATHIAVAESAEADILLTCDDRLLKRAKRTKLRVVVANPKEWLESQCHEP